MKVRYTGQKAVVGVHIPVDADSVTLIKQRHQLVKGESLELSDDQAIKLVELGRGEFEIVTDGEEPKRGRGRPPKQEVEQ